ncbi:glycosyltransferase family 2 protein [uncultured Roseobacter sp.]|uniref:glycosyltransferase family 2 protein n=1 Tax=uncultured Roseobacter sp. TaxID=114847 RepID=UPI00262698BD|nr:glycosyltransferase family 2 protein [uncultured Roseobacter sp.]
MMKDEAPYLIEWFAHHLAVGFTDILVYTNDCTDGTDDMLIRLEELGLGHHRRNVIPKGIKPQPSAIKHAQVEPLVQESDWVLLFDADEFLCINYGDGKLDSLLSAAGKANGIVITWRIFGSGGVTDWSRAPVTEQYQYAAPPLWNKGWGVKTLFKHDADYWKLGIHRPKIKAKHLNTGFPDTVQWLNGSGLPMEDYFKFRGWRSIRRTLGYDWAQMNHYAVKSIDSYAIRKFRGNVNLKKDKYNGEYWALQDRNEVRDTSILRYAEDRARIVSELLKDPVLGRLHNEALDRVDARLAEFKQTDAYAALKAELLEASKTPLSKVNAKPPKARDPAKIAALMSEVEKKSAARPKSERRNTPTPGAILTAHAADPYLSGSIDRSSDITFESVANHGVQLPADPRVFKSEALAEISAGKFDRRHARHLPFLLDGHRRILMLGAGVSFLPILACLTRPDSVLLAHEERKGLSAIGREIAASHDIASNRLKIVDGPLFFASDEAGKTSSGLKAMVSDFAPTVLFVDDPRLTPEIFATSITPAVRRIVVSARLETDGFPGALGPLGFATPAEPHKSGAIVLDRAMR